MQEEPEEQRVFRFRVLASEPLSKILLEIGTFVSENADIRDLAEMVVINTYFDENGTGWWDGVLMCTRPKMLQSI